MSSNHRTLVSRRSINRKKPVIISIATIPTRFKFVIEMISSLESQSIPVKHVIINVCSTYKRFKDSVQKTSIDSEVFSKVHTLNCKHNYEKYVIHQTEDKGTGTAIYGCYKYMQKSKERKIDEIFYVCTFHDDILPPSSFINDLRQKLLETDERFVYCTEGYTHDMSGILSFPTESLKFTKVGLLSSRNGLVFTSLYLNQDIADFFDYFKLINMKYNDFPYVHVNNGLPYMFLLHCYLSCDSFISLYIEKRNGKIYKSPLHILKGMKSIKYNDSDKGDVYKGAIKLNNPLFFNFLKANFSIFETFILKKQICRQICRCI